MEPTSFEEENHVLSAPLGMQGVEPLNVCQTVQASGYPVLISCYKPTKEELDNINKTGRVWLIVAGAAMPPVRLDGFNPFKPLPSETMCPVCGGNPRDCMNCV